MRNLLIFFLFAVLLSSCGTLKKTSSFPPIPNKIDLDGITDRYIDLSYFPVDTVDVVGKHKGDRIVFSNAQNIALRFDAKIETEHTEDAIAFLGPVTNFTMMGKLKVNNSITFWDKLDGVEITGLFSRGAHTGIRFTQPFAHKSVYIHDNTISKTGYEGIYAGPSYENSFKLQQIRIARNRIVETGWDAIQVGNCLDCVIEGNFILKAATKDEKNQNWAITVNPGSRAHLRNNRMLGCKQRVQILDSRAFVW